MKTKVINIMGGGTAGWISSLYFLIMLKKYDLKFHVNLILSETIETIGVGEGTTVIFKNFINKTCNFEEDEFLKETKGSYKYGIKFKNWNFDDQYYYHLFSTSFLKNDNTFLSRCDFYQYCINEDLNISQKKLQKFLFGSIFDLLENKKISKQLIPDYAYHFDSSLVCQYFKKKCVKYENFSFINDKIVNINYNEDGSIESLFLNDYKKLAGDFFINCLGFHSKNFLDSNYFDFHHFDDVILNNSAFAIQVKNNDNEELDPYTTSTAHEYGWTWKIPQYEKTGYGYVYCDKFIDDQNLIYEKILDNYKINPENIIKTKNVKSISYYNKKILHKNCLSLGLSSGFVEPLEATSIEMTIIQLKLFFDLISNNFDEFFGKKISKKYIFMYNQKIEEIWKNILKFITLHYFSESTPNNDYWIHYSNIKNKKIFDIYEKKINQSLSYPVSSYHSISLGLKIKDYYYDFSREREIKNQIYDFLNIDNKINYENFLSHKKLLNLINARPTHELNDLNIKYF